MTREWKPGDVALIRSGLGFDAVGLRSGVPSNMGWAYTSDEPGSKYGNCWMSDPDGAAVIRPLVVIDPEDREQVERLATLLWPHYSKSECARLHKSDITADALREFANPSPPKPEEPLGLGAVIEDAEGYWWVSAFCEGKREWYRDNVVGGWRKWSDIDAVRVLSEGVEVAQ